MPVTALFLCGKASMPPVPFETKSLPGEFDATAPDGSGIRILPRVARGSLAHGTLAPGSTSLAVRHVTVDEIWYVLAGSAEVWRANEDDEAIVTVSVGDSLTIPVGTGFQFRTIGTEPFQFIMCTMPPWPDGNEAMRIHGRWPVETGSATP
jgi:mannose-6-phosphate isomerase-like protein (cupin superfamily)